MSMMVPDVAVLIMAAAVAAGYGSRGRGHAEPLRLGEPVIDARTERELRARYLNGEIGIDVYLDRRFGPAFSAAGDQRRAG